jgi:hypothetical protein
MPDIEMDFGRRFDFCQRLYHTVWIYFRLWCISSFIGVDDSMEDGSFSDGV